MSWTNAVVTAAGQALQASLAGTGKGFIFTRAASGAGIAEGDLTAQAVLTDERQALSLQPAETLEGAKKRVQAVLANTDLQTGYTMHQLGFFARAEDSADEILYAIVQDETGDAIPSAAESPGFSVDWTYIFSYGNAAEVEVQLDPAGLVSWAQVGAPGGVAPLGADNKVPAAHLPEMDYAPLEGLPTNDIRTVAVRAGQTIAAGEVVNVRAESEGGAETVYKDMAGGTNNSADCIALEAGTGGSVIRLGYGGYCPCPGVTEGQEIAGAGADAVSAAAPRDGWLWIDPAHAYIPDLREAVSVPTVTGSLAYTGAPQNPTWSGYDPDKMTIGGQTSATNAGTYQATFTPRDGYKWDDDTDTAKTVEWSIGKATPTLSLNPTSLSLVGTTPKTSTITYNGDGVLSAQSNSSNIATASVSGTTLSVTATGTGSTTITVTAAAGTNYNSASATLSVSAIYAVSFATDSWETIAAVSEAGVASQVYSLGDTKDITLSGIGTMTLEIADFDHDYLSVGTSADKAGISMITRDLLPSKRAMNNTATNVGGFPASDLCDYLNGTILNGLPSDLSSVLKTIYKWYGTGNNTSNGVWRGFKIWVPLEYELFGLSKWAPDTEHTTGNARKYPIFTDDESRSKRLNNGSGSKTWYWEASPMDGNSIRFCGVFGIEGGATPGGHSAQDANDANGVCFGLCV